MNDLDKITHTIEGYRVKDLRWLPLDNIIVGLVECPIWSTEKRPFVSVKWRKNGLNLIDKSRTDLNINVL